MTRIWGAVQAAGWRQASRSSQQGRGPARSEEKQGLLGGLKRKAGVQQSSRREN